MASGKPDRLDISRATSACRDCGTVCRTFLSWNYSYRSEFTGSVKAALMDWKLTVITAINKAKAAENPKIQIARFVR